MHTSPVPFAYMSLALTTAITTITAVARPTTEVSPRASSPATNAGAPHQSRIQQVNAALHLRDSRIITLDIDPAPGKPVRAAITINNQPLTMQLQPHSIRAHDYRLRAQLADGSLIDVPPGPVRTMRGRIEQLPHAAAAASMLPDGLHGSVIMPDGERWWFEPLARHLPNAAHNEYALYRNSDVLGHAGSCGNIHDQPAAIAPNPNAPIALHNTFDEEGAGSPQVFCAEMACDADVEYFQAHGSNVTSVQNQIERVTNQMDLQYINEVGIDHVITQIIVRTAEPDPYTADAAIPLVTQFRNHWLANHGNVRRDLAQLFTGRDISAGAGGFIGYAFQIGAVCTNNAYCVSQSDWGDCCNSLACATDLSAHELGHLWNAVHCSDFCESTMYHLILCTNTFMNASPSSIAAITAWRNGSSCLEICGSTAMPFFESFALEPIDMGRWTNPVGCEVNESAFLEPSEPWSLNLMGHADGVTSITSAPMDAAGAANVQLGYWHQQGGGGDDPGGGADLVVEYLNSTGEWLEIDRILGSGPAQNTFAQRVLAMPADARHSQLRVRFRNLSLFHGLDDWFVDDVQVLRSPINDNCTAAPLLGAGTHAFTTLLATTDGPDETGACGVGQVGGDIWYRYGVACAPGTVTVSVCDANFDTRLAVYGGGCPGSPGALACNDDFCGDGSQVTLNVASPTLLRIRVGGAGAQTGSGNLVITCTSAPVCPADITGGGTVDIDDLLAVINNWGWTGAPGGNPADIAPPGGNGAVDIDDLLMVINGWGACP